MANIFSSSNVQVDYKNFESEIFTDTNSILYNLASIQNTKLKKLHISIYTTALLAKKVKNRVKSDIHKFIFLSELLSDSLTTLPLLIQGYHNSYSILVRRITENFFHHIFYYDHFIEFDQLNKGANEYVPMNKYKDYALANPRFNRSKDLLIKTFIDKIFSDYQELCKIVHSKGIDHMVLANKINLVKNKSLDINQEITDLNTLIQAINYLLIKFHSKINFTNVEKRILADSMIRSHRSTLFMI